MDSCSPDGAQRNPGSPCPLAKIPCVLIHDTSPVSRQQAFTDIAMKRRVRPVSHPRHAAMLDRVEVDVIHMPLEIVIIPDRVFPESSLPQNILSTSVAETINSPGSDAAREVPLDLLPSCGEISVTRRQGHDDMKVIGQDDNGIDREGACNFHMAECVSQCGDIFDKCRRLTIRECDGEEESTAGKKMAAILDHGGSSPGFRCAPSGLQVLRRQVSIFLQVRLLGGVARGQLEQPRGGAAEDVVLALLREERQVIDHGRQVEVPVWIVR